MNPDQAPLTKNLASPRLFGGFLLAILILLVFQLSGCALIGYGVGAVADATPKKPRVISGDAPFIPIKPGTNITVYLKTGGYKQGKCLGLWQAQEKGYADTYAAFRDKVGDDIILPALGERLTLVQERSSLGRLQTSGIEGAEFLGFDFGRISVQETGRPQPTLVPLPSLYSLRDQQGNLVNLDILRKLMSEQKVPFLRSRTIGLLTAYGEERIDLTDVSMIEVRGGSNKLKLFMVGLAVDVFMAFVFPFQSIILWILWGPPDL